jgi:glutaredoxin 3
VLKDNGVEFTLYSVDGNLHKRREMIARGGGHSLPQIFVDQRPIGEFDEFTALNLHGELDPLLALGRRHSD